VILSFTSSNTTSHAIPILTFSGSGSTSIRFVGSRTPPSSSMYAAT